MKKSKQIPENDELRPGYDASILKSGVRGKHFERYQAGTNLVLLAPDVAAAFPTESAVNEALRSLIKDTEHSVSPAA